jgi:hypothetical protein
MGSLQLAFWLARATETSLDEPGRAQAPKAEADDVAAADAPDGKEAGEEGAA